MHMMMQVGTQYIIDTEKVPTNVFFTFKYIISTPTK